MELDIQDCNFSITDKDGNIISDGKNKNITIEVNLAKGEDITTMCNLFEPMKFSFRTEYNSRWFKDVKEYDRYTRYKKRIVNRNKLYRKLKKLGRKL